jgi:hypothetical protein
MTRTNGQVKAPPDTAKVEVILPTAVHKRHVTKFETDAADADVTNIYLRLNGLRILGNPSAVKITVEAYQPEA